MFYDAHNRLVAANGPDDTVALSYDATGRFVIPPKTRSSYK
ncbi:hypothetical protein ACFODR_02855 [Pseudidiomarina halophila]